MLLSECRLGSCEDQILHRSAERRGLMPAFCAHLVCVCHCLWQALGDKNYVAAVQVRLLGWAPWQLRTLLAAAPPREGGGVAGEVTFGESMKALARTYR